MQPPSDVTWIKVDPPSFDLLGVLVSSLSLTGVLAVLALLLGAGYGVLLIRRRRWPDAAERTTELSLHRP
jgi:hypothetical protein